MLLHVFTKRTKGGDLLATGLHWHEFHIEASKFNKRIIPDGFEFQYIERDGARTVIVNTDIHGYELKNDKGVTIEKYVTPVPDREEEYKNPLHDPANHDLQTLFKELCYGRPADSQRYLHRCIKELNGEITLNPNPSPDEELEKPSSLSELFNQREIHYTQDVVIDEKETKLKSYFVNGSEDQTCIVGNGETWAEAAKEFMDKLIELQGKGLYHLVEKSVEKDSQRSNEGFEQFDYNEVMEEGCTCQNCGNKYKVDFLVPDEIWGKISPKKGDGYKSGGLLCGRCIADAIEGFGEFDYFHLVKEDQRNHSVVLEYPCSNCGKQTNESAFMTCCSRECLKSWLDKTNAAKS